MSHPLSDLSPLSGRRWTWRGGEADPAADLVDQLLRARGCTEDSLSANRQPTLRSFLPDPALFMDMDRAAARLADAVMAAEAVTIFGDYDVDGATSAALLVRYLRALGLRAATYIPDRLTEGYGPSAPALLAIGDGGSRLIITVDCGAQAFDALSAAADAGIDVMVIDHHQCAEALPRAFAVVNPNRRDEGEGAAYGHLAAVGVVFLLAVAVTRELRQRNWFKDRAEPNLLNLLDLVALGTVADVARLTGLNRAFVAQGLKVMAARRNPGIAALFDVARLTRPPQASDLGFLLGPRINAGGRVGRADLGTRLLTTDDAEEAAQLAAELDALNSERRAIEAEVQAEAESQAETQAHRSLLVVAGTGWHPGVIGIVAGRLKEKYDRPALVIALDPESGEGKGSGRSIIGVDLGEAILAAKSHGHLIAGGGHAMAAGLTVATDKLTGLSEFLDGLLAEQIAAARATRDLALDLVVAPRALAPRLVTEIEQAGPYGTGWPAPRIAAGPFHLIEARLVGNGGHVRALLGGPDGARIKAMAFRAADTPMGQALLAAPRGRKLWTAGRARIDDWAGGTSAELHLDDIAWVD